MKATEATAHLRHLVRILSSVSYELLGLRTSLLPAAGEDPSGEDESTSDPAAQVRAAIDCVFHDCILPAILDLTAAARMLPNEEEEP